ncbi:ROK family protein [Caldicoprobacter algeriensis]|uniref:ROK family protein n=1 Tax=Caldicoprobacter algeriensis TaxID=699281 RepID=UPI00207A5C29|nr:ROK family protein [Caldicoprobacter algeriensis]MCM8900750.1 ROK family protein [Caldicoprobacter algeriensis]
MEGGYLLGIDIGGTKCAVVLGDKNGTIYRRYAFPTREQGGPYEVIEKIIETVGKILDELSVDIENVNSIGISCGGPLDTKRGLILSPPNLPGWDEIPIVDILKDRFKKDVFIENDANACAVAEWKFGAGRGCNNMIFLTFGTGLGAGLILNGRLYRGASDMAGEVGHIRLAPDGPVGYGKAGSFEGFCSGGGIAQLARDEIISRLRRGEKVAFCPTEEKAQTITAADVGLSASQGDPVAIHILQTSGRYLGMGLAILVDILNPERIILGGIFARCREFIQPAAEEALKAEALPSSYRACEILPAGLGERIGDLASLCVAMGIV